MNFTRFAVLLVLPWMLLSCRSAKSIVAAVEVKPTSFLTHGAELQENRKRSPFLGNWWSKDPRVVKAAEQAKRIHIAPVVTDHLRPMKQKLTRLEFSEERRNRKIAALAQYTRKEFTEAFRDAKDSRYTVAEAPGKDTMVLKLSLFEWEPNTFTGLLAREAVDLVTLPMMGDLLAKPARGSIAIEGMLIEPKTGKSLFEFADKEEAKTLFFFFPQELFPSGQAKFAIREWARQFERLMSTPADKRIKDSLPFRIIAY